VAGWGSAGPAAFFVTSFGRPDFEPFNAFDIDPVALAPSVPADLQQRAEDAENSLSLVHEIVEAQRQPTQTLFGEARIVGGSIEMTTIDRGGIHARTLGRWQDPIGETLRPQPLVMA
jgi:hypothetical protein